MNPDDIARILDELGERLGPAGEATWAILVAQKSNEAAAWLGFWGTAGTLAGALTILCIVGFVLDGIVSSRKNHYGDSLVEMFATGFLFFGGLWGVIQWLTIQTTLQAQSPAYYALRDILGAIGGAR